MIDSLTSTFAISLLMSAPPGPRAIAIAELTNQYDKNGVGTAASQIAGQVIHEAIVKEGVEQLHRRLVTLDASLQAAVLWRRSSRIRQKEGPEDWYHFHSGSVMDFIAKMHLLMSIAPPKWWVSTLLKGVTEIDDDSWEYKFPEPHANYLAFDASWESEATLRRAGDSIVVESLEPNQSFRYRILNDLKGDYNIRQRLDIEFHDSNCLFLVWRCDWDKSHLVNMRRDGSRMAWKQELWSSGWDAAISLRSTPLRLRKTIHANHRRVLVAGYEENSMYLEVFELDSGLPVVRFSTNNWYYELGQRTREQAVRQ